MSITMNMHDATEPVSRMVDVAFDLSGARVPRDYAGALGAAVAAVLPWLGSTPGAALHRLNTSAGGSAEALLLSGRTRLTLRVPRERVADARALSGRTLDVAGFELHVGTGRVKELLPWGTLYAHVVAVDDEGCDDPTDAAARTELAFVQRVETDLAQLGVPCRAICGRAQLGSEGRLRGFSVMLDGLTPHGALRVLEQGLGGRRLQGCGVFVPHKSAAAVGAPP